ncbi:MAG: helix-turn-helix domain-containing protein [Phycisphaerae bacterium]
MTTGSSASRAKEFAANPSSTTDPQARPEFSTLPDPCTAAEFAAALGKSPKTIVDWCQERDYTLIPCFRLGNKWYHRKAELMRWLNGIKSGHIKFRRKPRRSAKKVR